MLRILKIRLDNNTDASGTVVRIAEWTHIAMSYDSTSKILDLLI